jgi:23S rRNA (cytosine1962-C5)-methyltransferase
MAALDDAGARYDIVVCDPPAFAKSRKDASAGLRAYNRMARLAARLVVPGGLLFMASCSHHVPLEAFTGEVAAALVRSQREARVLYTGGAGPDHPVHPNLPESAYLKAQLLQLS